MPDQPVPLREALREAVHELVGQEVEYVDHHVAEVRLRIDAAWNRLDALLSQIPIDLEAREGDDG